MIFKQEYQRKQDRVPVQKMAGDLDRFFESVPKDTRYHIELRTDAYLTSMVFEVLEKHGVGQVLSHWTWLPPLRKQLLKADNKAFNSGKQRIVRLMTPIGMRYEDAYAKANPFDKLVEGMMQPVMLHETAEIMRSAITDSFETRILINNRAGGNVPLIAQKVAEQFLRPLIYCLAEKRMKYSRPTGLMWSLMKIPLHPELMMPKNTKLKDTDEASLEKLAAHQGGCHKGG
jgi:hypothetical protein